MYTEYKIPRADSFIYAREWKGKGPTYLLLHGFPDNLKIYDQVAEILASKGKHVVSFDFLGFGKSGKPQGFKYSFAQQLEDMQVVADFLKLEQIIPVGHDSGGHAAINFTLDQLSRIDSLILLNTCYSNTPVLKLPELIELCANPKLRSLALAAMSDGKIAEWILKFQAQHFNTKASAKHAEIYKNVVLPIITENFLSLDSSGAAFMGMTSDFFANLSRNDLRLAEVKKLAVPVKIIWGSNDPYLNVELAEDISNSFAKTTMRTIPAGHWVQIDEPGLVAEMILS